MPTPCPHCVAATVDIDSGSAVECICRRRGFRAGGKPSPRWRFDTRSKPGETPPPRVNFWYARVTAPEDRRLRSRRRDRLFLIGTLWFLLASLVPCCVASIWNQDFLIAPVAVATIAALANLARRLLPACPRCGRRGILFGRDQVGCRKCRSAGARDQIVDHPGASMQSTSNWNLPVGGHTSPGTE
jgi:hypothetical protein